MDGRVVNYFSDDEVDFLKKHVRVANAAHGTVDMVTASGKPLGLAELHPAKDVFVKSLQRGLKKWNELPESERKPGAIKVPERGDIDPKRAVAVKPPAGVLVIRVYNRQLGRTDKGELRHTIPEDYIPYLRDPKVVSTPDPTALFRQPSNDFMWIPRNEWLALLPDEPKPGQRIDAPRTLTERIFRYHLDPARGLSESDSFSHVTADAGMLEVTVEVASPIEVRLRIDGYATLNNPRRHLRSYQPLSVKEHSKSQIPIDYRPRLLGYISFDVAKKKITRFDMVALGDVRGRPVDSNLFGERLGEANLLGIAFELVANPSPADYVNPKGLRGNGGQYDLRRYFGLPK